LRLFRSHPDGPVPNKGKFGICRALAAAFTEADWTTLLRFSPDHDTVVRCPEAARIIVADREDHLGLSRFS
jgi:hypothetical protein